jgi:hypothetical protein
VSEQARRRMTFDECIAWAMEPERPVHHERGENGIVPPRIVRDGPIVQNPPGSTLTNCGLPGGA